MLGGLKFDLNIIGYFFWFILFGLVVIIISIIYRPDYIFLGALLSLYGMLGFFIDLLIDRICSRVLKKNFTSSDMFEISIGGHFVRFILQVGLIFALIYFINTKYSFIQY
ncbi:MAG: hypothetical protein A2X17_01385 [Bacteroidetes bacterium GWF2_41_61]|nr:MAG: hypothetical protein A2X17_01385 [Bacteroidetes bacterium GWF2_41_61]OFY91790.1 MAG: hypothetical protein A2266_07380 [Bacteroidetes bacterium RIFOXYA12_FULL_40_10]